MDRAATLGFLVLAVACDRGSGIKTTGFPTTVAFDSAPLGVTSVQALTR